MASTAFGRGSQTCMNTIFFKPTIRKVCHRKSSSTADSMRGETTVKNMEAADHEEVVVVNKKKRSLINMQCQADQAGGGFYSNSSSSSWVPHERTGIYYPKGQEKVIDHVPCGGAAANDIGVINWF